MILKVCLLIDRINCVVCSLRSDKKNLLCRVSFSEACCKFLVAGSANITDTATVDSGVGITEVGTSEE